ncbi:asparagine synthase (glutamine-hydrolyzing) [Pusillimonas sp. NJUB218]|uniref:asparagine synthase (glutamine-hydrolyzing) n=1 Tax=Pusillimonas sp. NJUB218 TaxID=2023230 RepID=UPI000F4BC663|nr:asparagine synthase (glutamine-hydrolyzing) [Pusillimonas sp. NJUB218]ROT44018.1 asparagine synthase (glutamine-hydrolyzing) [Pusillimonas sp. NJUB218]
MCGFAGIANFHPEMEGRRALCAMTAALTHRGPDGEGMQWHGDVGLGHRRLAIVGLAEGKQPVQHEASGVVLVFNGEIYNYIELAKELGVDQPGMSDTDVLLHAYCKWGMGMLPRLFGMFSFAIHDPRENCIYIARDRLGIKPLYYYANGKRLIFSSELGALMCSGLVPGTPAVEAMAAYLNLGYVPTPGSIYRDVVKLPPATTLKFELSSGKLSQERYWHLRPQTRCIGESEATEELRSLLGTVVSQHLRSDVAYGAFLSGGIDSTLIVDQMTSVLGRSVQTFTMGFLGDDYSDLPYAAQAAATLGTRHEAEVMSAQISPELLGSLASAFGEPFADSSFIPTYLVSKVAASRVKMVLSGDGGDELFGGYHSYKGVVDRMHDRWRLPALRLAGRLIGGERGRAYMRMGARWNEWHHLERALMSKDLAAELISNAQFEGFAEDALDQPLEMDPLLRCQQHDLDHYLLDDILTKVDRMSMAHGLEVRVPLLDHRLVEFAFNLPLPLRVKKTPSGLVTKVLLKNLLRPKFSHDFIHRRKMGFGIPLAESFNGSLKKLVGDLLLGDHGEMTHYVNGDAVRRLVVEYYAGNNAVWTSLWTVLCLRLWFESKPVGCQSHSHEIGNCFD